MDTLLGIVDRAWRRSVHSQERNAALCQVLGSLQGQTGKILKKEGRTVMGVPACPYENPRPLAEHVAMGSKVLGRDPSLFPFVREIDEDGFADQDLQGDAIEGHPALDDMRRSIQMGSQVVAEADRLNRIPILLQTLNLPELRP